MSSAFFSAPPFILVAQLFMDPFNVSISDCFAVEKMSQFCHPHWFTVMFLETNLSETAWNGNISLAESDICFWRWCDQLKSSTRVLLLRKRNFIALSESKFLPLSNSFSQSDTALSWRLKGGYAAFDVMQRRLCTPEGALTASSGRLRKVA